jgi:GDP-mannose 6-dehydrogenase
VTPLLPDSVAGGLRLSVFGLGYVGCVSAACLASRGHLVLGVDANPEKAAFLRDGRSPIVEERIGELIGEVVAAGWLRVSDDPERAVLDSDATIVCVGTPSGAGGSLSTEYLERASEQIGAALATKDGWHVVVYRSTMIPGTCEDLLIPLLERSSGKKVGVDFGVCLNPEFLREGTSVRDFLDPPKTVVGESDERSGALVMSLYDGLPGPRFRVPIPVAEMTKYVDNSFHALKVTFANEIGSLAKAQGLDGHRVLDILCADTKLNLSPTYLRPGFAFGGSCLPKDVRALRYRGRSLDLDLPVLNAILPSNAQQLDRAFQMVADAGARQVGVLGLAFKAGTDDLRESPMVEVVERLIGKGYDVCIYDANVNLAKLVGANKSYILDQIPHISDLMVSSVDEVLDRARTLVIGNSDRAFRAVAERPRPGQRIVDLVRIIDRRSDGNGYDGICW